MLSHEDICTAVGKVANEYSLIKASYFGSYAEGRATEKSDLDLLVEFVTPSVSILKITGLRLKLQDMLNTKVDVIHAPLSEKSRLVINSTVVAYEQNG